MERDIKKIIFIVGCPRSGTTLLQKILLNISGSFSLPETNFFKLLPKNYFVAPRSLPPFFKFQYPKAVDEETLKRITDSMKNDSSLRLSEEEFSELLSKASQKSLSPKELFIKLMSTYSQGNEVLIEKTPVHIYHVPYIKKIFSDAVILNIVRDPRDVYLSFNKMLVSQGKKKRTPSEFSKVWNGCINYSLENNLENISYEDLVKNPLDAVNQSLQKYNIKIAEIKKNFNNQIIGQGETWKENVKLEINQKSIGKYQQELSKKEAAQISRLCRQNLKHFNYQPTEWKLAYLSFFIKDLAVWNLRKLKILQTILLSR